MNPGLIKNFDAGADILANLIVKFGTSDTLVIPGAASADELIGVNENLDVLSGEPVDVIFNGIAPVKLGGTVTRGDFITSDATGQGVAAAPAAGVNAAVIGRALQSGVTGDIIDAMLSVGRIQG